MCVCLWWEKEALGDFCPGETGFLAISDTFFFRLSCRAIGAAIVVFSMTDTIIVVFGIHLQEVLMQWPGFLLLYRCLFIGIGSSLFMKSQGGCRYGLSKMSVTCRLEMRRM